MLSFCLQVTLGIIPVSKYSYILSPIYKQFRPFGRGTTPVRGLTIPIVFAWVLFVTLRFEPHVQTADLANSADVFRSDSLIALVRRSAISYIYIYTVYIYISTTSWKKNGLFLPTDLWRNINHVQVERTETSLTCPYSNTPICCVSMAFTMCASWLNALKTLQTLEHAASYLANG